MLIYKVVKISWRFFFFLETCSTLINCRQFGFLPYLNAVRLLQFLSKAFNWRHSIEGKEAVFVRRRKKNPFGMRASWQRFRIESVTSCNDMGFLIVKIQMNLWKIELSHDKAQPSQPQIDKKHSDSRISALFIHLHFQFFNSIEQSVRRIQHVSCNIHSNVLQFSFWFFFLSRFSRQNHNNNHHNKKRNVIFGYFHRKQLTWLMQMWIMVCTQCGSFCWAFKRKYSMQLSVIILFQRRNCVKIPKQLCGS